MRFPRVQLRTRLPYRAAQLGIRDCRADGDSYRCGDFILEHKNIGETTIIAFRPDMTSAGHVDQLRADTDALRIRCTLPSTT